MIQNKTFQLKLSHLIIGGILLLLLVFLVKCKPTPTTTNKYDKQKKEIEALKSNIALLKVGQQALNKQLEQQDQIVDSLNTEIKLTEQELQTTRTYYGNKINNQIIMKLGLALFFTLISILVSGQCGAQCTNLVQNSTFGSSWSNWTKQTGWGISTYGSNTTTATNTIDNSPAAGYFISQTITNVGGTKLFRLDFDAYAGAASGTGTAYLDFYIDSLRFVRLISTNGTTTITSTLYNGADPISTSNWTINTWKRGYSVYVPWTSSDSNVVLKVVFISNGSTRDWGVDNISLCRFQTLDLNDVKYTQRLDSI